MCLQDGQDKSEQWRFKTNLESALSFEMCQSMPLAHENKKIGQWLMSVCVEFTHV